MEIESEPGSRTRSRWTLTPEAFDRLLARLSSDREEAARDFEELRRYLTTLFTYAGSADPERLADITLDRAAKRLSEGEKIESLKAWLRGAARNVLQEERLSVHREAAAARAVPVEDTPPPEADHAALEECLDRLTGTNRKLIEAYYRTRGGRLYEARGRLAAELGISTDALRTRALRIRKTLEDCFRERRPGSRGMT